MARPPVVHHSGPLRSRSFYVYPYRRGFNLGFSYGYAGFYGSYPYWYGYPSYGYYGGFGAPWYGYPTYGYPGYGYRYRYPRYGYGYGYPGWAGLGQPYGGVRIDLPERDAEVFADGYFVGSVNDFDGTFQELELEAGPHRIEIRAPGFEPIAFDVNVEPGRTITYRTGVRPALP